MGKGFERSTSPVCTTKDVRDSVKYVNIVRDGVKDVNIILLLIEETTGGF